MRMVENVLLCTLLFSPVWLTKGAPAQTIPSGAEIDAEVGKAMTHTDAKGLALAVIDGGKVAFVKAYGVRNAKGEPLTIDTVMYGASLTKAVFAYTVMQLVDQGKLGLDTPIKDGLSKPLPSYGIDPMIRRKYGPYGDLAGDARWEQITPRICLTHSTGFANFWFVEPDQKLRFHTDPGRRYGYSGEGLVLLQFAIEHGRPGVDVGDLARANFQRLGMTRTSMMWRKDFAGNLADGWNDRGVPGEHDQRSKVRAAGSMDTTISDFSKFVAALVRGDGLSEASRAEMVRPQLQITTPHQFPSLAPDLPADKQRKDLHAGLGVITFEGPQGAGFYKGGHDHQTANTMVCIEKGRRCVLILSNDVRSEAAFAGLVKFILGDTGVPYEWEYGDSAGKS